MSMTENPVAKDFLDVLPFSVQAPPCQAIPFVFNSPHSGRYYPQRFLAMSRLDAMSIRRSEDCHVDRLFAHVPEQGAPLLHAHFPRAYLDVNREILELDPRMFAEKLPAHANMRSMRVAGGLGTVPRIVAEGVEIYPGKLRLTEALQRIDHLYRPYHDELRRLFLSTHARFGHAILIDCHSMPSSVRLPNHSTSPDFIIGDRHGMSAPAALSELAISLLQEQGFHVAYNKPYAGGFITEHYGRPQRGLHAIQIEINRGLYMDENTYRIHSGFGRLAQALAAFTLEFARQASWWADSDLPHGLAAE